VMDLSDREMREIKRQQDLACTASIPKTVMFDGFGPGSEGWRFGYQRRTKKDGTTKVYRIDVNPEGETMREHLFDGTTEAEAISKTLRHLKSALTWSRADRESEAYKTAHEFVEANRPS